MAPNLNKIKKTHEYYKPAVPHPGGVVAGFNGIAPGKHRKPLNLKHAGKK